ncbi:hypothetical protein POM88_051332 [Heracleum sosnowskyi]|uniref:Protein kinase domain-containing protein n=1 Tax=Heracleum sosnowskyi TaxID=360622 RepID=A0AAD8H225_9APIA|nr:hypothetical protein POM88_051332 [Heracleum sosnowskyi]
MIPFYTNDEMYRRRWVSLIRETNLVSNHPYMLQLYEEVRINSTEIWLPVEFYDPYLQYEFSLKPSYTMRTFVLSVLRRSLKIVDHLLGPWSHPCWPHLPQSWIIKCRLPSKLVFPGMTRATDIWDVGMLILELLNPHAYYEGGSREGFLDFVDQQVILSKTDPRWPNNSHLVDFLQSCLAPLAKDRPSAMFFFDTSFLNIRAQRSWCQLEIN